MSTRAMRSLLATLGTEVQKTLQPPADPRRVMEEYCRAMTAVGSGRPIELLFRAFPPDILVSGMRLDCGDRTIIVVEEATAPEAQFVIFGHELWHEEKGGCGHHVAGLSAAARALAPAQTPDAVDRAVEQILDSHEVPGDALLAVAARAESIDEHEVDAETFGLLFGRAVRSWMNAHGPVSADTVEGRMHLSLHVRGRML